MKDLLAKIEKADARQMDVILKTAMARYKKLHPDWEISVFTLDKREDRDTQIDGAIALLQAIKTLDSVKNEKKNLDRTEKR